MSWSNPLAIILSLRRLILPLGFLINLFISNNTFVQWFWTKRSCPISHQYIKFTTHCCLPFRFSYCLCKTCSFRFNNNAGQNTQRVAGSKECSKTKEFFRLEFTCFRSGNNFSRWNKRWFMLSFRKIGCNERIIWHEVMCR